MQDRILGVYRFIFFLVFGFSLAWAESSLARSYLTADPNPCELVGGASACNSLIGAQQRQAGPFGQQTVRSCVFIDGQPLPLMCGHTMSQTLSIPAGGLTLVHRENEQPSSREWRRLFVSTVSPVPGLPGTPYFSRVEWIQYNPVVDANGALDLCWSAASGNPSEYQWQRRLVSAVRGWPATWNSKTHRDANDHCAADMPPRALLGEYRDYQYRVRACNANGCSQVRLSPTVTIAPEQASQNQSLSFSGVEDTTVTPPVDSNGQFRLHWTASPDPVAGYWWRESTDPTWASTTTTFVDLSVALTNERQEKTYQVAACIDLTACPEAANGVLSDPLAIAESQAPSSPGAVAFQQLEQTNPPIDRDGTFTVAWGAATGTVNGYRWEALENSAVVDSGTTTTLSLPQTVAINGITRDRTYRVQAFNLAGDSPWTEATLTLEALPSAPGAVSYTELEQTIPPTDSNDYFVAHWGAASGTFDHYAWEVLEGSTVVANGTTTELSTPLTGLQGSSERTVTFQVRAVNGGVSGDWSTGSAVVIEPPVAPTNLTALRPSDLSVYELSWNYPAGSTVNAFEFEPHTSGGPLPVVRHHGGELRQTTVMLDQGEATAFRMRACNANDGCSPWTIPVTVDLPLQPVDNLQVVDVDDAAGTFHLRWNYSAEARAAASGNPDYFSVAPTLPQEAGTVPPPNVSGILPPWGFHQTGMLNLDDYVGSSFDVRACHNDGTCGPARLATVRVHRENPSAPIAAPTWSASPAIDDDGHFALSWNPVADARVDYYEITEQRANAHSVLTNLVFYSENANEWVDRDRNGDYTYTLRACQRNRIDGDLCSAASAPRTVAVQLANLMVAPSDAGFFATTGTRVRLRWSYPDGLFDDARSRPHYFVVATGAQQQNVITTIDVVDKTGAVWLTPDDGRFQRSLYYVSACGYAGCGPYTAIDATLGAQQAEVPPPAVPSTPSTPVGGPGDLNPGVWWNPAQDGTGWYFFWASELRYPSIHESYGDTYDLIAYWAAYRLEGDDWTPTWLVANLKQVGNHFEGALIHPQANGGNRNVGSLSVLMDGPAGQGADCEPAQNNRCIAVTISLNDQAMSLGRQGIHSSPSDSRTLLLQDFAIGNVPPGVLNPASSYSGLWWPQQPSGDHPFVPDDYAVLNWIETDLELMFVFFYDQNGQPIWVQGQTCIGDPLVCQRTGTGPYTFDGSRAFYAVKQGFAPLGNAPPEYDLDANVLLNVGTGTRSFSGFNQGQVSLNIQLPPESGRVASLQANSAVTRGASFHDIRYFVDDEIEGVSQCNINLRGHCDIELTWFTDDDYSGAAAYYRRDNGTWLPLEDLCGGVRPTGYVVKDYACAIDQVGTYEFELRQFGASNAPAMARSETLSVVDQQIAFNTAPEAPPEAQTMATPPAPPVVGATPAGAGVDAQGAANYTIPIHTVTTAAGFVPNLSLQYSSAQGDGPLGVGWTIGGPGVISRCSQDFIHDGQALALAMNATDRLCFAGQRLFRVNDPTPTTRTDAEYWDASAEYRSEVDSLIKVTWAPGQTYLIARFPDGSHGTFGRNADAITGSRIYGFPGNPQQLSEDPEPVELNVTGLFNWAQDTHQDAAGNFILYEYTHIGRPADLATGAGWTEFYLGKVRYSGYDKDGDYLGNTTGGVGAPEHAPYAEIAFHYETTDRPDASSRWLSGGTELRLSRRLSAVTSREGTTALRHYDIGYDPLGDGVKRSIVANVQECRDATQAACFGATELNWGKHANLLSDNLTAVDVTPNQNNDHIDFLRVVDIDADGRHDLVTGQRVGNQTVLRASLSNDQGLTPGSGDLTLSADLISDDRMALADTNHDGRLELVYAEGSPLSWSAVAWNGGFQTPANGLGALPVDLVLAHDTVAADVTGDGADDLIFEGRMANPNPGQFHPHVDQLYVATHDGSSGYDAAVPIAIPLADPQAPDWALLSVSLGTQEKRVQVGDVNGDGLSDLLVEVNQRYCVSGNINAPLRECITEAAERRHQAWWLLKARVGGGFDTERLAHGEACEFGCDATGVIQTAQSHLVDVNADGLSDWLYRDASGMWFYQLNVGIGFVGVPQAIAVMSEHLRLVDIDGNGFLDLLHPSGGQWQAFLWHNEGYATSAVPVAVASGDPDEDASFFADLSGDGRVDYMLADRTLVTLALKFTLATNSAGPNSGPLNAITEMTHGLFGTVSFNYAPLSDRQVYAPDFGTINVCAKTPTPRQALCQAAAVYPLTSPHYVVKFHHTVGTPSQTVHYRYGGRRIQAGGRGDLGFATIQSYQQQSPTENLRTTTTYRQDYPFIGRVATSRTEIIHPADWPIPRPAALILPISETVLGWETVDPSGQGALRPYLKRQENTVSEPEVGASVALRRSVTEVTGLTDANPNTGIDAFGFTLTTTTTHSDLTQTPVRVVQTQHRTDRYAHRVALWQMGLLASRQIDSLRDGATCAEADYSQSTVPACIRRQVDFVYDATRPLLQNEILEPQATGALKLTTTFALDAYGNATGIALTGTGVNRSAEVVYGNQGRFVDAQKNAYGQIVAKVVSRNAFGQPLSIKDIHDQTTTLAYDPMGQAYFGLGADGSWAHSQLSLGQNPPVRTLQQDGTGTASRISANVDCPVGTVFHRFNQGGGIPESWQCFDALGQTLRNIDTAFDGRAVYTDGVYDTLGRVTSVTEPFYAAPNAGEPSQVNRKQSQVVYDALSRVIDATNLDGERSTAQYQPLLTVLQEIDPQGVDPIRRERYSILGELVELVEDQGTGKINATTLYSYDALGQLIGVTDPDQHSRSLRYDVRGQRIHLSDPDLGPAFAFAHNALGEVTRQWQQTVNEAIDFVYDDQGRLISRVDRENIASLSAPSSNSVSIGTWAYDNTPGLLNTPPANGTGLLQSESTDGGFDRRFDYDPLGRLERITTTIDPDGFALAETFSQGLQYDEYGRLFQSEDVASALYPGAGIKPLYNAFGHVRAVNEAARPDATEFTYATVESTNARGQITSLDYANGLKSHFTHDALGRLLTQVTESQPDVGDIQSWAYRYDAFGNLDSREDRRLQLKESLSYDGLHRLVQINLDDAARGLSNQPTAGYRYSKGGKLLCMGTATDCGPGSVAPDSHSYGLVSPNALGAFTSAIDSADYTFSYDSKGNQAAKSRDGVTERLVHYTLFNKPEVIENPLTGTTTRLAYDPNRQRYLREDLQGGQTTRTFYIGSVEVVTDYNSAEQMQGRFYRRDLGVATQVITDLGNQRIRYVHRDRLGSTDVLTDEQGDVTQRLSFDAQGQRRKPDDWRLDSPYFFFGVNRDTETLTQRGFTGHEQFDEHGLIHMNGRTYDPQSGRFMQADPFIPNPGLGQSYNRYSYVNNNPLTLIDPSGFQAFDPVGNDNDGPRAVPVICGDSGRHGCSPHRPHGGGAGQNPNPGQLIPIGILPDQGDGFFNLLATVDSGATAQPGDEAANAYVGAELTGSGLQVQFLSDTTVGPNSLAQNIGPPSPFFGSCGFVPCSALPKVSGDPVPTEGFFELVIVPTGQAFLPDGQELTVISMTAGAAVADGPLPIGDIAFIGTSGTILLKRIGQGVSTFFVKSFRFVFRKGDEVAKGLRGFSTAETKIIGEAQGILSSPQFATLRAAQEAGQSASVRINGRLIQFEPGLPASGMTMFGENGFLIGREAFRSAGELNRTVLHELFRLRNSASSAGVSGSLAAQETRAAFDFAERAAGALK